MSFDAAFRAAAQSFPPEHFRRLQDQLPESWVSEALAATGTATVRKRRLPAESVLWLVIGMAMFRDHSIEEVIDKLDLALPSPRGVIAKSAIPKARKRLGAEPVKWLLERVGGTWARASAAKHKWNGLELYGIDGSSLRVADTPENRSEFGGWSGLHGDSSHPLVRLVVLMALRSHLVAAASFGSFATTSEMHHATELLPRIPDGSLTILDRLFLAAPLLLAIQGSGVDRHWLTRAKANTSCRVMSTLGTDDEIVEMKVSDDARRDHPDLPKTWQMRRIRYKRPNGEQQALLTSLLDHERYPKAEIVEVYHERWELELAYDEVKTELLDREETIRSKSPEAVAQELWGVLLAFNLVRFEMERIAEEAEVAPTRISFVASLHFIREFLDWSAVSRSPGSIPRHLRRLSEGLKRFIVPPRRSERAYPRRVKNNFSRYRKKVASRHAAK